MAGSKKRLSKSTLSMYLRTKCDRELYLSLHTESELKLHGMPVGLQARPAMGVLQTAGIDFEDQRNSELIKVFGQSVVYLLDKTGKKPAPAPLSQLLTQVASTPAILLQAKFDPKHFQDIAMANIGLSIADIGLIPAIDGLIPDVIVVRKPVDGDEEILPTGMRAAINTKTECRLGLSIIDIKHTSEANPSYSAEVALYAFFLANWLVSNGLQHQYVVLANCYLWTRFKQGHAKLDLLTTALTSVSSGQYLEALIEDSEDANLRFYLPTVMHFFREDLIRVIKVGDAGPNGWQKLDWHVDGRCSSCDWLGHIKWADPTDRAKITAQPTHYCYPAAQLNGHLSQIAGLTRGARKTLLRNAILDVSGAAVALPSAVAFQEHTHLKKERNRIPFRAQSLLGNITSFDNSAILASLSPYPQLHAAIAVNFDPSSGLLTGLSVTGRATAYIKGQSPRVFTTKAFVVDQKDLNEEWVALEGLLSTVSDIVTQAEKFVQAAGKTPLTAQISFWEKRQFEELCAAMGRHLPRVLSLTIRKTRALAWLFPADELIEKPDGAVSPCIVFVDEIVKRVVFAPTPHVITLFDTAENYFSGTTPVLQKDAYYREFLTHGIPRERIYEIWSGVSVVKRGNVSLPRNTVIAEFHNALDKQCRALNNIVEKLRTDFKGQLKANAPRLNLSIPHGAAGVAFDAKLWIWWDELQFQTKKLASHQRLALDGDMLEASFEAIRLTNGKQTAIPSEVSYDVLPSSTEAKLDATDSYLALGKDSIAGFPLLRAQDVLKSGSPPYPGPDPNILLVPLWASLSLTLVSIDRNKRKATVRFSNWRDTLFGPYFLAHCSVDLMNDIFVTEGQSTFKWYEKTAEILRQVGNPPIAVPDQNAAIAMGMQASAAGSSAIKPIAGVLWDASTVHSLSVLKPGRATAIAKYAKDTLGLNDSQRDAVSHAAEKGLSIIWGPPGTGKTLTLTGCIHGLVHDATSHSQPLKILVTGPTYKAVEQLIHRVVRSLAQDASSPAEIFIAYADSAQLQPFTSGTAHVPVSVFKFLKNSQETSDCLASLKNNGVVTIVATTSMQCFKFSDWLTGSMVGPIFDIVVIDESSQVQLTHALSPLATLKSGFRLVVAGDHLQMPPITSLEPPTNAEYLVGSIQRYLRDRQFAGPIVECPLEENYRSAEDIVAFARSIGYRPSLKSVYPETKLHVLKTAQSTSAEFPPNLPWSTLWLEILDPNKRVLTLLHEDDMSSQSNLFEAQMVASLVWDLRNSVSASLDGRGQVVVHKAPSPDELWEKCIGIVTPHRAQRALVIRELKAIFPGDPVNLIEAAVDTVEKFQGGERQTIIVTFGVGDADVIIGEEIFLMQLERTNVAISRAMAKCIVIMPMTLAGHVPHDKKALATAHAIKDYVDEFCNAELTGDVTLGSIVRKAKLRFHIAK